MLRAQGKSREEHLAFCACQLEMPSRFREAFRKIDWLKEVRLTAIDVIKFVGIFHVASTYGVSFTKCIGPSMEPTLNETGDYVLIDNFSYRVLKRPYKNGDVVICVCPYDSSKTVCKRITAEAGDLVVVRQNANMQEMAAIPEGQVWLAGDNSHNSTDSRFYGPVPIALLRGRVFFKLGSMRLVPSGPPPPPPPPKQRPPVP